MTTRRRIGSPSVPERIFAQASTRSIGGTSIFEAGDNIDSTTVGNFLSEQGVITNAVSQLQAAGFEVLHVTQSTINIAGSQRTYESAFNTTIVAEERPTIKETEETTATYLECPDTDMPGLISTAGTDFEDLLEGVAIEEPRYIMAPSMYPPLKSYWHLQVPAGISLGCNADRAHRGNITGRNVRIAMVDSGWYKHPFFVGRGYRSSPVILGPGAANPLTDEIGHGTGESANIFAVAPDVQLLPVKINFSNSVGAFNAAVALAPDIITCSWGSSQQFGPLSAANLILAGAVAAAVAGGIIVIFSAGNGQWGFPGQHPDVISAGGVYMDIDESLQASNYASGFMSNIYPERRVPDLSGLVGMRSPDQPVSPGAMYIMLPLEEGDAIDQSQNNGGANHYRSPGATAPFGDETASDDGWAVFSGTSAAAPQLAGAAALIKQACPRLTPAEVRDILMRSARDVTTGNCSAGTGANPATVGPDTATGNGLVDAHKAVLLAKIRCRPIIGPVGPGVITPVGPVIGPSPQPIIGPSPQPIVGPGPQPIVGPSPQPIVGPQPIIGPRPQPIIGPQPVIGPRAIIGPTDIKQVVEVQSAPEFSASDIETLEELALNSEIELEDLES